MEYIHDELGVTLPPQGIAQQVIETVIERLEKNIPVLPGASDALERLANKFQLVLATSAAFAVAQAVLVKTGWEKLFAVVVSADAVAHGKPAPDVYVRA